ncbi:mitochondrial cytochrome c oxidase subunit VIa [Sodiomyces alkalinus F11]|uniref:Cytochrome c oxidase subunit n=1 Tax=Sodiomyces alkalinus (strain CBS 110278 / VKM F-3762 / F11) TaxID=1314773 RepID=A0A3N2Q4W2_SODAK|nr:mitochondrial cytochrome c oxidase subunit VIa [Sodiomyces alkalinus F11]ROT41698.1 mitochondrial cytochrome c oxidase subunit VIa [Sodiomyces alkalinus F11]
MVLQRQLARAAPRYTAQLRATAQRRLASTDNAFIRERQHAKEHAAGTTGWDGQKNSGCIPALAIASWNAYRLWNEHWEHWSHLPPLEERTEYPYQNIRTKNFAWGDGDKTVFWNDKVNYHNKDKTT